MRCSAATSEISGVAGPETAMAALALSLAVTYWDYRAWKDKFAHPAYTARQWEYSEAGGRCNVSTPQMIVNGRGVSILPYQPREVTQVDHGERILSKEDPEVSAFIADTLRAEGVEIRTGHKALRCEGKTLIAETSGEEVAVPFDEIIVAVGRKARLRGYGLEELGIARFQ
jgi:hypothetical protein